MKSHFKTTKANRQLNWGKVLRIVVTAMIAFGVVAQVAPSPVAARTVVAWGGCAPNC